MVTFILDPSRTVATYACLSSKHGHLLNLLSTPVTFFRGGRAAPTYMHMLFPHVIPVAEVGWHGGMWLAPTYTRTVQLLRCTHLSR